MKWKLAPNHNMLLTFHLTIKLNLDGQILSSNKLLIDLFVSWSFFLFAENILGSVQKISSIMWENNGWNLRKHLALFLNGFLRLRVGDLPRFLTHFFIKFKKRDGKNWFTHHNQKHKINPIPKAVSILNIIHYIRPSFQRYYLPE